VKKEAAIMPAKRESVTYKRKCVENNSSCYSNSVDSESHKIKPTEFQEDVNMENGGSQVDDELAEGSYVSNTDKDRKSLSELDCDSYSQMQDEG